MVCGGDVQQYTSADVIMAAPQRREGLTLLNLQHRNTLDVDFLHRTVLLTLLFFLLIPGS